MIYFHLQLPGHTLWLREVKAGTQGKKLEARTEMEAFHRKGCLWPCSTGLAHPFSLFKAGLPVQG